ncbi:MAG TPA: GAF domain-containing protein [Egibacteraceae bacterium]|nr:GAF domain-containing protein [Egibacteraceae bacterium]
MPDGAGPADPAELLGELAALASDLGGALGAPDDLELLSAIASAGRALFGAAACSVALLDDAQSELVFRAAAGPGADEIVGTRVPVNRGIAGWAVSAGQAIAVDDVARDPRFARDIAEASGYVPTSMIAAPLQTEREILGVISVLDPRAEGGSARRLEELSAYAEPAALAIEGSRRFLDVGRALLGSIAAVAEGAELQAALRDAAERAGPRAELAGLAAQFAELGRLGEAERRAAAALVDDFLAYVRARRD